jgi:pSer/pThr/pTyr-binding forkhead associated (FHA) protein
MIEIGASKIQIVASRVPSAPAPASTAAPTMIDGLSANSAAKTGIYMGIELVVVEGPDKDKRFPIGKMQTTIGRASGQDVQLTDNFVSREHAILSQRGGKWFYENRSDKGSMVNGSSTNEKELEHGDRIVIGSTALEFQSLRDALAR